MHELGAVSFHPNHLGFWRCAKVLGRRRRNGAPLVAVHHMAQGVVAFTSPEAAERFGERLDEDGHEGVALATLDSHALFRMTGALVLKGSGVASAGGLGH